MSVEAFDQALKRQRAEQADAWGDPVPLFAEHERPEPYPIDALPPIIHAAVITYQAFGQQPIELVACSALAAASLACQGLADVDRDGNLTGPCSLDFMIVSGSGERKTGCDKRMKRALSEWQESARKEQEAGIAGAEAKLEMWEREKDGLFGKIKKLAGSTRSDDQAERQQLKSKVLLHEQEKPKVPPQVKLFYEDVTPEELAVKLATGWPSASLWSDEGGLIVGGNGMSEEVITRFLGLLNRLWDGNPFDRDRLTRTSAHIRGRRFTASIMLQPKVFAKFVGAADGMARGIGALARFFIARPGTTIGTRVYEAGDLEATALLTFDKRLRELLDTPLPIDEDGALQPPRLRLSAEAFEVWRRLHDRVECELGPTGDFAGLPDIGAKIAEQAARLACVFHVFEYGPHDEISQGLMVSGGRVALWHLHEARRVFSIAGKEDELADAKALLDWLQEQEEAPWLGSILQFGPYRVRNKERRDKAIEMLREHGLAKIETRDGRQYIIVNPKARP